MYEHYCKYQTAVTAKERGFNPPIHSDYHYWGFGGRHIRPLNWYNDMELPQVIFAPRQAQLQGWIRDVKEIHIEIYSNASGWGWILTKLNGTTIKEIKDDIFFDSYEKALEVGIKKALVLIKTQK